MWAIITPKWPHNIDETDLFHTFSPYVLISKMATSKSIWLNIRIRIPCTHGRIYGGTFIFFFNKICSAYMYDIRTYIQDNIEHLPTTHNVSSHNIITSLVHVFTMG